MAFEIVGDVTAIEMIAAANKVRQRKGLRKRYDQGRWRKRKRIAKVRLAGGGIRSAEIHWYEAHGIGRRRIKIKRAARSNFIRVTDDLDEDYLYPATLFLPLHASRPLLVSTRRSLRTVARKGRATRPAAERRRWADRSPAYPWIQKRSLSRALS